MKKPEHSSSALSDGLSSNNIACLYSQVAHVDRGLAISEMVIHRKMHKKSRKKTGQTEEEIDEIREAIVVVASTSVDDLRDMITPENIIINIVVFVWWWMIVDMIDIYI